MGGFSLGEFLLIAVLCLVFLDPKDAGRLWGKFQRLKRQLLDVTDSVKGQLQESVKDPEMGAILETRDWWSETDPAVLRRWAKERLAFLDAEKFAQASEQIKARALEWSVWQDASDIALYVATPQEFPTDSLIGLALVQGKRIWLPRVTGPTGMEMVRVAGPGDLVPGRFGILEPRADLAAPASVPKGLLVIAPGLVFDRHGHRIGKGKGFYDRWFAANPDAVRAGLCFDVQVHPARLEPGPHDMPVHHLLTEYRLESF